MPEIGEILGDRYRIVEVRRGGMGEVFICELIQGSAETAAPQERGKPPLLALKTYQRRLFFDSATRISFVREASTWLRLSGLPHILPVLGIEQIGDRPFVRMAAVLPGPQGERSVADLLRDGSLAPERALGLAFQLALAMRGAAERIPGLVHGDLKPENVLLLDGNAFLSDFGLVSAVSLGRPDLRLEGSWAYRAPELWADEAQAPSVASDLYAFGVLVFEMLTGRVPFTADPDDREAWAAAHRSLSPEVPPDFPADGLPAAALELVLACLDKDPARRPRDFAEVLARLGAIGKEHDPFALLLWMMPAAHYNSLMKEEGHALREERIRSLLEIDEPRQALEELEAIPPDEYSATLWMRRGTAFSLLHRDEEALGCFERVLEGELPPRERVSCQSETALSLKRLGRFDEARDLYEHLLTSVPDDQVAMVIVNLSTVYLEQKQGEEAVRLLERFVRTEPGIAVAWANLGQAYVFAGRYGEAESAYGRALTLSPQEGKIRVKLAALYMDHLGRLDLAWAALDAAFDSGHESREWLVRMLSCSLLLDRRDAVYGLLHGLENHFPEALAKEMRDEALDMTQRLARKYSGEDQGESRDGEPEEPVAVEPDPGEPREATPAADTTSGPAEKETVKPSLPFLNFRFYGFHDFTIDFYQSPAVPGFMDTFLTEWRRAMRDPRFGAGGASLRGSPFYFTRCPGCGVHVLTNRDVGYHITCRMCETRWQTEPIQERPLDEIVRRVSEELGIQPADGAAEIYALFVQAPAGTETEVVREVCQQAGMTELRQDQLLAVYLLREALQRRIAKLGQPWTAWMLSATPGEAWVRNATPRAISRVVRELRERVPGGQSLSTTLPADVMGFLGGSVQELQEQSERELRETLLEGTASASDFRRLAELLMTQGRLAEAEQKARAAVAAEEDSAEGWGVLGRILVRQDEIQGAREALERAVALDPTSVLDLLFLGLCYERLGDTARAGELRARAHTLSGGEFPWRT